MPLVTMCDKACALRVVSRLWGHRRIPSSYIPSRKILSLWNGVVLLLEGRASH